jgi:RNA polymerase sigma-70 factor (ECF subfamily)
VSQAFTELHRAEAGAVLAYLIRVLGGDFALAEDVAQEAFTAAFEQWPTTGTPPNPAAWLKRTARNKAIDRLRRRARFERPIGGVEPDPTPSELEQDDFGEDDAGDDQLRLIFTCCNPALSLEAQVALTLHTLCGLTTEEIARAFLVDPTAMAQRLVRAKNKIKVARIPYRVPDRAELPERLHAVLAAVYLVFSEGYAATRGDALIRHNLSRQALRLGSLIERLMPDASEPKALVALMLLHEARRLSRTDANGDLVLLEDQDRSLWDRELIALGIERVQQALRMGGATSYGLQAAIAALHAEAPSSAATDWPQIDLLYHELLRLDDAPVVRLNHAAAAAMVRGPEAGLALLAPLEPELSSYHLFYAARADLLRRVSRHAEARRDYETALALVQNEPERRYLGRRIAEIEKP